MRDASYFLQPHIPRGTRNAKRNKSPGSLLSARNVSRNNDDIYYIAKPWTRVSRFSMAPLISRAPRCLFALNERRNCREASPMPERRLFWPPSSPPSPSSTFQRSSILPSFANNRDNGGSSYFDGRYQRRLRSLIATP